MSKNKYNFIFYLKAMAALLILNSHFDQLYPIPALATGGAIGNAIFFAVSGFCSYPVKLPFGKWYAKKIVRIYVPAFLMILISILTYYPFEGSVLSVLQAFIWPTIFWFIGAISIFYILFYLLDFVRTDRQYILFFSLAACIYIGYYLCLDTSVWVIESNGLLSLEGCFKLIYYFTVMMVGKWFRIHCDNRFKKKKCYIFQVISAFLSLYAGKYLIMKNPFIMHFQFINQLSVIWLVVSLFLTALSLQEKKCEKSFPKLHKIAVFLSNITLEIYLVQFLVIHYVAGIFFPLNVILAIILVISAAWLLYMLSSQIVKKVWNKSYEKNRNRNTIS